MSWEEIMSMESGELRIALQKAHERLTNAEKQVVFKQPSGKGTGKLAKGDGIEEMKIVSAQLFPDRPDVVRDHWELRKLCHCDDCDKYFGEGKHDVS